MQRDTLGNQDLGDVGPSLKGSQNLENFQVAMVAPMWVPKVGISTCEHVLLLSKQFLRLGLLRS